MKNKKYTSLYKNQLYKNNEPQNDLKTKNKLRTNSASKCFSNKKMGNLTKKQYE